MRLFNRLSDESRSNGNQEKKVFRGRKSDEGKRREGVAGSLSPRKLGMENLEERQLLSVNPIGNSEYDDIRNAYADLELPSSLSQINVIELTDLNAAALQNAVDLAARTTADDLILLRTTADDYVVDLESTAINVNIDSEKYGSLTIVGTGEQALTIETVDTNAFTVLNGDVKLGGAVLYNYSTNYAGQAIVESPDANVKLASSLVMIDQATTLDENGVAKTSYLVDSAMTEADAEEYGVSNATAVSELRVETVTGDYNQVRNRVHATLREQYHYFGYNPAKQYAPGVNDGVIYDAASNGAAGWVGTVANMMAYTGWAQEAGFSTTMTQPDGTVRYFESIEDAVAEYLRSGYLDAGGSFTCAQVLDYLFDGDDENCMGSNLSGNTNQVEGGGLFMDIDFTKVGGYVPSSDAMIDDMLRALREGHAVTAEIVTTRSDNGRQVREYVSVWGYYYNPNTRQDNGSADYVGLICSNPTKTTVQYEVTDNHYEHPNYQDPITNTLTHYRDESGESEKNTYNTYLLERSGSAWRLAVAPYTYLNDQGAVQGARTLPEGFSYYGGYENSRNNTFTSEIVGFSWLQQYTAKMHEAPITEAETLSLESMPGNTENVIYLHFAGADGTGWDGLAHPALDLDGSAGYGVSELKFIQEVWARVAEDYAPFNVNVTTDPNVWANATNGVRCVVGGYSPSAGGLSYVGCFGTSKQDNYVYPLSLGLSAKNVAEAAAHEIGHAMGLSHDGYEHNEYYGGNGTWAPIMGTGYGATITQWSDGSYVNATNREDDVAIIASKVGYRNDDFGDTIDMAEKLDEHYVPIDINTYDPTAGTYVIDGVIENRDDYDMFSFVSHGGTYVVDVAGAGADHRFIDGDFSWNYIRHGDVENAVFAGKYYASTYDYANLNVKVELLDENGEIVLLDMDGKIQKLGYGESIVLSDDYYYYVVDQFGKKVYNADGSLKEGYQAVDDSTYTTFSHFVTPELEAGKTYYISVTGVGQGNDATNGYSDYGSLGQYTLSMHESYENFYIDAEKMDVESLEYATGVDNVLNWQEAFVYSGRRLEDGSRHLGNTLTFDASLSGQTLDLRETLRFTFSRPLVDQPFSEKRFVLDATAAWDAENDRPGITIDANEKFRVMYVDNTTVELYGFTFTGGVAETTNVIYLYFGGIDGPGWSGEAHPAYDLDGDPTSFNDAELEAINEIYLRVAEDYAPFNVTVTTDQDVFNAATNAIRVVVGGTGNNRGGVAYLNSFGTQKQDCYVFPNSLGSPKSIAEAISHEVGHTLNLSHDGKGGDEYYGGTNGWAPIMGAGYYQALTQWSKGEYQGATQTQDDLAYIAARLGYKADDYSDKRANAAALRESYIRPGNFVADGLIERTGDVDMFSFVATDSTYVIDVVGSGADYDRANAAGYAASLGYTNLDLRVELYDDAGKLLYTCDPTDSLFAHFEATGLIAGDSYFVRVTTTGRGNPATDGYSNYGAIGQYYVTVSAGTLADFVGEERYTSVATRNAVNEGAINATKEKGETYGKNGQTNNGGGIYNNYGWLTIGDSVIAGNRALKAGGGIYNSGGEYEDNAQHDGWLYLVNTSIVGNIVTEENSVGGGLYNESGAVATLVNVTVAGNTADYSGGGIQNAGRVNLYNTIVAENEASYGADVYTQSGKTTRAENSIIGDESRNSNYTAYKNGTNSTNVGGTSFIGTSRGSSVSSPVTTYDPKFVSYRGYDAADWSSELWKSWNLRLQGDSLAVDLGNSANLTNDLDFGNGVSNGYNRWGQDRYFFTADYQDDLAGQPRFEGDSVDAGAYEVLGKADLTEFVPSAAGSDVVNDWESSIVISRAEDDQTGSIAPFLADENLFLNLSFINQGAAIADSFETTVYMWKYDPKTSTKQQMFADSKIGNNELALLNVKVDFAEGVSMPGGDGSSVATITLTNLATGDVQTVEYDGANSFIALTNVALGSIEDIINGFVANGALEAQNEEGYYVFGYQLDSGAALDEYSETNNFYLTSSYFDVVESPVSVNNSIVVTTTADVVDAYDGEISLREAVEIYAGSFYYREVALPEGATFESGGVTYTVKGGKFYVDNTTDYRVYPGESFSFTETVSETIVWDAEQSAYVDAEGNVVALTNGDKATFTLAGVEYVDAQWDEAASAWTSADFSFAAADVAEATLSREAVVTVVYAEDVYFDADNKAIAVPNGTKGEINGVAVEMVDGVWTSVSQTSYNRDQVQAMGNFFLADGTEVAVVNGVFRRVATNDVAVVLDGSTVTLANGESAVYDAAKGVFVVTTTVEYPMAEGSKVVVDGVELTFVERAYVDSGDYRYYLTDGVVVTLANGYEVEYNARKDAFVFKSEDVAGKLDAGSTILWEGETYSYKAGVAIVQKVSREANAVVFDAALDGQTFVLTQGELTLSKSFTLDCVDPDGQLLDLTIQGVNSRLFTVETGAEVEIKNFKLANSTSSQDGGVVYNKGTLTIDSVAFSGNESNGGVGGSIYNASGATLTVSNTTFSGDSARDGASIYNAGSATIQDSTFDATGAFGNGVVYNVGTLVVDNTQFNGGSTASSGGAIYNAGTADVSNSIFDGTAALNGGAIYNAANGTLRLADSDFANVSATVGGAIYNVGNATIDQGSFVGNSTTDKGGALYNEGTATVVGTLFAGNSASVGGAFYSTGTLKLTGVKVERSEARDGAAIYSTGTLSVSNSLIAKNVATGLGGAIYNAGTATLTNATIADNQAADGAGLYNAGTATVDNTILAGNKATDAAAKGFDLYTVDGATTTLRSSLLGNVAQYGDKAFGLDAAYRSFLGVDPQFVDAANGDYTLSATSPAINGGSNALDGGALVDFAGNDRRVGLTVGGVVMSVDMGAFEYQAIIAPDLDLVDSSVDYWQTEKLENGETVELDYFVAGQDVCVDFNVQNVGDAAVYSNFGYTMTLVGTNAKGEVVYTKTQDIRYYASSFDRFDWLNESDWIAADGSASLAANLGALPAGRYSITLTLDVDGVGKVVEWGEEDGFAGENNNVYAGTFDVFEAPSSVVTTEQDVVDPTDGLTSIREAIAHAGAYEYVSIFMVADGTQYVLEDGQIVTVENGSLTVKVDVVEKNGALVDLQDGDEFLLNGRPIYYRSQLNGGYFAYSMEDGAERADVSSGEVTFPDGAAANLQLNTDQYVSFVDGTNLNPSEGDRYSYQTLVFPNGEKVILTDGAAFEYANVKFTYRQNDEYPDGAFVFENGSVVSYADGGALEFANLSVGTLQTRNEVYRDELILADGSKIQVIDGVARLTKAVEPTVTFAESMQGKTITVDAATGPIEIADVVVIDGEDRDVTLDGANSTGIFLVQEGGVATISRLTATRGAGAVGGAVVNRGELTLNEVDFANNNVRLTGAPVDGELTSGLGGAIYNVGTLTVAGGAFENNFASEFGGAIFSKGELVVKNASFVGGSSFAGGAIAAQAGTLTVENTTFTNNVAEVGGAVYTLVDATFVAVSFVGNQATNGNGGAIYAGPKATITFAADAASESTLAVSFEGNKATGNGGALYTENDLVVAGDLVAKNNETTDGAALYIGGGLTVDGSATITGSKSATSALVAKIVEIKGDLTLEANDSANAAIESAGAVAIGGSATIAGNKTGGAISANGAVSFGGDLTAKNNVANDGAIIAGTSFNVGGAAIFENNESTTGAVLVGGAVEIAGALNATGNKATAGSVISGSTIIVGADATLANNESTTGALTANEAVEFGGTLTATGNKATDGAIISGSTVNVVGDATLANNESTTGAVLASGAVEFGGALTATSNKATAGSVVSGSTINVVGAATLESNESTTGVLTATDAIMFGATLAATGNQATDGAIISGSTVDVVGDATLANNESTTGAVLASGAVEFGGALTATSNKATAGSVVSGSTINVVGAATLESNESTTGVLTATDAITFGATLAATGNKATDGAIISGSTVNVAGDATLTNNESTTGAVLASDAVEFGGALTAENNKTSEGSAVSGSSVKVGLDAVLKGNEGTNGAAIFATGDVEIVGALTAENNKATGSGGAISAVGSLTVGGDATLTGNEAAQVGGAIAANGAVALGGSLTATNNAATVGGAIISGAGVTVELDATLTGNTAAGAGGAIAATQNVEIGGALTATDNKAANGGAISANGDVAIVGALTATNNEATGTAGGVIVSGASVSVGGDATLSGNKAAGSGGAIAALENVVIVGAAKAENNAAGLSGGAIAADGSVEIGGDATFANNAAQAAGGAVVALGDVAFGGSATLTGNSAGEAGGAISANGSLEIVGALTASDNTSGGFGGAVAVGGAVEIGGDATLAGNEAKFSGGAIYSKDGDVAIVGALTASDNKAGAQALEIETTKTETLEDGTTVVTTVKTTITDGAGGAIAAPKGDLSVGGDATLTGNSSNGLGGAIYAENATFAGNATFENNAANAGSVVVETTVVTTPVEGEATTETTVDETVLLASGGAVYAGAVEIGGALTAKGNQAANDGGAFNVETLTVDGLAKLTGNSAQGSGGAIYASTVALNDGALLTDNVAGVSGGAVYANALTLVNATVAGNEAANGGALYVGESATLDNTIVAGNKATGETGEGVDVYVATEGTVTLRNSLLQNVEVGAGELVLVEEYRSILGVDPQFNDDYSLKATSPAINAGSNALAGASDVDLAGASRYVGLTVDGEVYAIDMGAFEYQTVSAPNLTFAENPVNFWYASVNGEKKDYYIFGEDVVLDFSFLNAASTLAEVGSGMVIDKFSVSFVVEGVAANGDTISQTFEYRYQPESDYFDWLSAGDWLDADELVSYARQNLGVLPVGNYSLSISLDVNNEIVERGEEDGSEAANDNVYTTSFEVREAPSTVVTTDKDVVDPTDDLISLREAVEVYAGSYWYSSTIMIGDGAEYVLDDLTRVVVKDGNATVSRDVATIVESQTTLRDGDKFAFGTSAMTFENGVVTYPDGTTATYDGENALTFTTGDGDTYVVKPESYYDYILNGGQPVSDPNVATVDVVVLPTGEMVALEKFEQTEFYYGETFATYYELAAVDAEGNAISFAEGAALTLDGKAGVYQNGAVRFEDGSFARLTDGAAIEIDGVAATFVGAAFVLPNGEVVEFVAGETLVCENGSTVAMTQVDEIVTGVLDLENGRRVEFLGDGSANVSTQVGTDVTFAANLDKATIKLESAITVDRDLTIDASDRTNVSVSGANKTNVFVIAEGATATMTSLSIKNAVAQIGAGVANYGTLSLVDVSISGTKATSEADEPFVDKILTEGVGAAIYNAGTLSVDGGSFANNVSTFHGGAIYSVGSLAVKNATFEGNVSEYYGGAIYVQDGTATVDSSVFKGNKAQYGGAVATAVSLKAANTIFTENIGTLGGALYAWGPNASIEATQSTLIANVAEQGGAIYVADAALTLKNSIVATNEATESATDLALVGSATATVYASLIGVADDCGDGTLNFDAGTRSFYGTTENPVDPALDAEGRPTAVSPALNSGSNALATATDGSALTADASGADRVVGVEKDGTIYSVDMGALEFQTVAAPDLGFFAEDGSFLYGQEKPVAGFTLSLSGLGGEGFSNTGDFVEGWDVSFAVGYGNAGNAYCFESFAVELKTVRLDADGNAIAGTETVLTRVFGDESGYFNVEDWLASGEAFVELWNLGAAYEAGQYKLTLTVDAADSVVELDETNNVFETNFAVRERPSLVVTTEQDVVNPYDGETSLREAIANVGPDGSIGMRLNEVLTEGETFVLAENAALGIPAGAVATYADGKITVAVGEETVELAQNVEYALADGTTFAWQEHLGCAVATRGDAIGSAITFAESVYGKTIELTSELSIDRSTTIDGTGANVVVSGANASRIATVARGTVSVFGLTFENGSANLGGAIYNAANLTLTNVSVKNSSATEDGGAIYNALGGELTLTNVEILGAAATNGGAIYNAGDLFGEEVAISGSNAAYGAGLYNVGEALFAGVSFVDGVATAQGGAIYNDGGELVVDDASFVGNKANYGGALVNYQGVATIVGATFASNKATSSAGAIDNYGELTLNGVTFENNEAAIAGGAIYNSESASNADAYSVSLGDVVFNGNSATTGGAIYNAKGSVVEATGAVSFSANSAATEGGAMYNAGTATFATDATFSANSAATGGAIYNAGTATLTGAKFDGNVATKDGGAVANVGTFYATTSEFVANKANGLGGAIYNLAGKASLANALVSQNVANEGGAIANAKGAALDLRNATIAANVATTAGGVYNLGTLNAQNSIIAANSATTAVDLYSNGSAKLLNSLVGSTEGIGTKPSATNSLLNVDPGFAVAPVFNGDGTLANGDALDLRLVYNSVAVDAGNNAYAKDALGQTTLTTDLDGGARVATKVANVDMGAYEFQFEEPSTVVTTDLDVVDVTDGKISLREAIEYAAQLGESTVSFAEGLATINLNSTLELDKSISIDASSVGGVWLDANGFADAASAIAVNEGAKVSLVSLTITNSSANAQDWLREDNDRPQYSGGAVWNAGELILRDATITGNVAAYGGGLYNLGSMRVYNSTVANNVALYYGGIYNRGELYVENSTIAGNQAAYNGGGVSNFAAATLVGTAVVGNRAETGAGVLALANASGSQVAPETTLTNCTVAGNVATSAGGGVWANDVLNVVNTIVAGNAAASAADVYLAGSADANVRYSLVGASNAKISGVGVKTNVDPNFVDFAAPTAGSWTANAWKAWNLELAVGSPAIDAGAENLAVDGYGVKLTTDLAGDKRVVGKAVDMGAYEEQGNVAPSGIVVEFNGELTTETLVAGTVVATLTTEDANGEEDVYEYELLGASDYFALDGDKIVATQNVPAGSYELVVRSTDQGGESVETTIQIVVVNPGAENYAAPTITSVANNSESALEVFWATGDPAKEYVVSYRVGDGAWIETNALTGEHGTIEGDFNVGDVVQVRIRAVGGVDKNGSDWSEVETYVVAEPPKAFDVATSGSGALVTLTIDSNLTAVAYWRVAWGDGTETVVNELSTQRVFGHVYAASGDYEMKLFVNNDEVGYELGVFEASVASSAVLETLTAETTNVFSTLAPVAVESVAPQAEEIAVSAALLADETVAWNEIAESLAVETTVETGVALTAAPATRVERAVVYEALGAAFAEFGADEFETVDVDFAVEDAANETAFDDAFLSELFGD